MILPYQAFGSLTNARHSLPSDDKPKARSQRSYIHCQLSSDFLMMVSIGSQVCVSLVQFNGQVSLLKPFTHYKYISGISEYSQLSTPQVFYTLSSRHFLNPDIFLTTTRNTRVESAYHPGNFCFHIRYFLARNSHLDYLFVSNFGLVRLLISSSHLNESPGTLLNHGEQGESCRRVLRSIHDHIDPSCNGKVCKLWLA